MDRNTDNRMLWQRGVDAVRQAPTPPTELLEVDLASEVRIYGEVEVAGGAISMRPLTFEPDDLGLFKYALRIQLPPRVDREKPDADDDDAAEEEPSVGTRRGYLFPGGAAGELAALISLQLQTRVFVLAVTTRLVERGGFPISRYEFPGPQRRANRSTDAIVFDNSQRTFGQVAALLDKIMLLPSRHHQDVAVAAGRYAQALRMIDLDQELVFVHLVSAVERFSADQPLGEDPLEGLKVEDLVRAERLDQVQLDVVTKMLTHRRIGSRFTAFLERYSGGFFEGEKREPVHTQVTPENLTVIAKAVYNARSGYLHRADPMYISAPNAEFPGWHMDPSVGMTWQGRRFDQTQKLPRADFFHRLVRHCILRRVDELVSGAT